MRETTQGEIMFKFDMSTPDNITDKEKLARLVLGTTAGFFAGKVVNGIFNLVKASRELDKLITKE